MNQSCNATVIKHESAAFGLPAGLDRSPLQRFDISDFESHHLNETIEALAPVLALDASDVAMFAEPADISLPATPNYSSTDSADSIFYSNRAIPHRKTRPRRQRLRTASAASPMLHQHHFKKALRKQVHELQATVYDMQTQVDCAAAEFKQLAELVNQFAQQRRQEKQEQEGVRRRAEQLHDDPEIGVDLVEQRRHFRAQVQHDQEQFEREQQRCYECQSVPEQETFRF
ncbi:hypothetical protein CCR75_004253 [Bremia lactucae]|uniref:Uncharacterized protein n=1 Tax=Bremia lactucae TaxID=4779 RepID=A0A976IKW9_BRELC|nr:hypothetical protein CCR75_004253 [Bremia lactucae]